MSENNPDDISKRIEGSPTKELFVHILTRDLSIEDAINDLIDNCIDGAKRLRSDNNYAGLTIEISVDLEENKIEIKDNCGGIPLDIARNYAFRFGRPTDVANTSYSIGQFGVGMKRAAFKLGTSFYVESKSKNSEFEVLIDINDWLNKKDESGGDDWTFEFQDFKSEGIQNTENNTGTTILINPLRETLKDYVSTQNFIDNLKEGIEFKHMQSIYQGIQIKVNDEVLKNKRPKFIISEHLKVAKIEKNYDDKVSLILQVGIGDDINEEGGWYVFCNDRLLLGPEQTTLTGWTGRGGQGVPHYHQQFNRFRGLAFFKAENASDLPWNTSKNNIDASSPVFLNARGTMIEAMKPVIKLLNLVKKERESLSDGSENEHKPYHEIISSGTKIDYSNLSEDNLSRTFFIPEVPSAPSDEEPVVRISYVRPKSIVEAIKARLNISANKNVGEKTFDYYVTMEEIDDE